MSYGRLTGYDRLLLAVIQAFYQSSFLEHSSSFQNTLALKEYRVNIILFCQSQLVYHHLRANSYLKYLSSILLKSVFLEHTNRSQTLNYRFCLFCEVQKAFFFIIS
jgi:hypothetical protein